MIERCNCVKKQLYQEVKWVQGKIKLYKHPDDWMKRLSALIQEIKDVSSKENATAGSRAGDGGADVAKKGSGRKDASNDLATQHERIFDGEGKLSALVTENVVSTRIHTTYNTIFRCERLSTIEKLFELDRETSFEVRFKSWYGEHAIDVCKNKVFEQLHTKVRRGKWAHCEDRAKKQGQALDHLSGQSTSEAGEANVSRIRHGQGDLLVAL